jgi:hypothetical protein
MGVPVIVGIIGVVRESTCCSQAAKYPYRSDTNQENIRGFIKFATSSG